jgi:RNA polymerase sigma-70 factor (ECF subfamily)
MASELPFTGEALVALRPRLRRFALGLCGSVDDADDLVQGAFERALQRTHQWQPGTRLDSWMFRIVQSIWFNQIRARRVRDNHQQREALAHDEPIDAGHRALEARITLQAVQERLAEMPEAQRAAMLLVAVEGLSYQEAADVLEVPVGTVTSRLGRARRFLIESLSSSAAEAVAGKEVMR